MIEIRTKKEGWEDIPGPHSTEFELMEYAKKNYPIGTKFMSATMTREATVKKNFRFLEESQVSGNIRGNMITDACGGSVYFEGKWAEILE